MKPEAKPLTLAILNRIKEREGSASKTKLLKLLYLADIEHFRKSGETLTGFEWIFYLYGPWTQEYEGLLAQLEAEGALRRKAWAVDELEGEQLIAVEPVDLSRVIQDTDAFLRTRRLVDVWAAQGVPALLDYVYFETEPMQGAEKMWPLDFGKVPREAPPVYRRIASGTDPKALRRLRRLIEKSREKLDAEIARTTESVKTPLYDEAFIVAYDALSSPEAE